MKTLAYVLALLMSVACLASDALSQNKFAQNSKGASAKAALEYLEVGSALAQLMEEYEKRPIAAIGESLLGFARIDELEADRAAFYNTYKAGYNPHALTTVLKRMARQQEEEMGHDQYLQHQLLILLFGNHPPNAQRSIALSWESNFVKMPAKDSTYHSMAFKAMKLRIAETSKQN